MEGTTGSGGATGSGGSAAGDGGRGAGAGREGGAGTSGASGGVSGGTGGNGTAGQSGQTGGRGGQAGRAAGTGGGAAGAPAGTGGQAGGSSGSACKMTGTWPAMDPSVAGPYPVTSESNVGPMAGNPDPKYNNAIPKFNVYRPTTLGQGGVCHPIITWGNGHGDQPKTYEVLLKQLASHGFVVVASLSSIPSQGTPLPQIAGVNWMLQENDDSASMYYHHLDTDHIGATGHSEGAGATDAVGADARIKAIVPIAGGGSNTTLHGPALFICGGKDTVALCSKIMTTFDGITAVPAMLAQNVNADHGSWLNQGGIKGPSIVAATAWMRIHLMGDSSLRNMFYGSTCKLCTDTTNWMILGKKMMDQ